MNKDRVVLSSSRMRPTFVIGLCVSHIHTDAGRAAGTQRIEITGKRLCVSHIHTDAGAAGGQQIERTGKREASKIDNDFSTFRSTHPQS